jgi:hypothetical protein
MVGALASMLNKPTKVKITGYKDMHFTDGQKIDSMELQINPDSITHKHSVDNGLSSTSNKTGDITETSPNTGTVPAAANKGIDYKGINPETLSFNFALDATGLIYKPPGTLPFLINVEEEIEKFKKIAYYYHGEAHGPPFVRIEWGKASAFKSWKNLSGFQCKLESLSINYTMFKANGTPLRAEIDVGFTQYLNPLAIQKITKQNSPDMTHVRTVQAGDNLPMMCQEVYGSNSYYLEVARVNGMTSIFNLSPGSKIVFPPLDK